MRSGVVVLTCGCHPNGRCLVATGDVDAGLGDRQNCSDCSGEVRRNISKTEPAYPFIVPTSQETGALTRQETALESATADSSSHAKSCTASASTSAVFRLPDMTRNSGRSTRVYQHVPKPSCTSYLSNWPSHTSSEPASPASVTGGRISIRTLVGSEYLGCGSSLENRRLMVGS